MLQLQGAFIARTYLVDPSSAKQKAYNALLDIQQDVIDKLLPGTKVLSDDACVRRRCVARTVYTLNMVSQVKQLLGAPSSAFRRE
jgi:hypothetical protein